MRINKFINLFGYYFIIQKMFRSLQDIRKEEEAKKGSSKNTESYTGGEKSGMAVENPDDIDGIVKQAKENSQNRQGRDDADKPNVEVKISLYQNGFIVEDGEFRDYNTEENKKFMETLNKGYVPEELAKKYNQKIGVALEDRRKEKWIPPPPPKYVAYSGGGQSLGGTQGTGGAVNTATADGKPTVDESAPKTTI